MLIESNRILTDIDSGIRYRLYTDTDTANFTLINFNEGEKINSFIAHFINAIIQYKFENGDIIELPTDYFKKVEVNNKPTHSKIVGVNKRFVKIK